MVISSSGALIDALRQQHLLTTEQFAHLSQLAQGRCADARTVCKSMIQRGWLSVYQVNQLLTGNARELVIGPYYVLDRLGQGGLSTVYKAKHRENGSLVAIKIIKAEVFASPEGRQQFLQEVEAMARLDHPNIVQFCDADQWNDTYFFAMEYVEGTDLGKVVRLSGALRVREACDYIRQAALGLQHAFERNLIHRDVKPVNLFLTVRQVATRSPASLFATSDDAFSTSKSSLLTRSQIKILDWGLASLRHPKGVTDEQTMENISRSIVGTADYLAPEQARNSSQADIRSDIYSLGCTFYYLLTGQAPFPEGNLMQKLFQHQTAEPRPIDDFRSDVPEAVTALVKRMTAKKPEDRFQTPASIALALLPFTRRASAAANLKIAAARPTSPNRDDTPLPPSLSGHVARPKLEDDTKATHGRPS